ncbi:hypothetical protein GCK72_006933 [Caenorhabditis remanei]|uniref:BRCT domain-containing protein n=1 Tax=Caenorhabditis remanei TaxID=31234 RepID=A0A6A5HHL2_CAERE|nr:hypothetical protein GCK72_006933 [Caenorhabditis remanei]KAF1766975.1 hypothetical protein GCK72_006933 [Caenorhabditis remanei]
MIVLFVIIGLLSAPAFSNGSSKEPSDLQLIAEDFQILARVTNAIALQADAIRGQLNARDAIAEFLSIEKHDLDGIIGFDPQPFIPYLQKVEEDIKNFENSDKTWMEEIKNFENVSMEFEASKNADVNLSTPTSLPGDFLASLQMLIESDEAKDVSCKTTVLSPLVSFLKLGEKSEYSFEEKYILGPALTFIQKQPDAYINCIQLIMKVQKALNTSLVFQLYEDYIRMKEVISNVPTALEDMKSKIANLKAGLATSSFMWNSVTGNMSGKPMSEQISRALDAHILHSKRLDPPLAGLTVAFFRAADLLKVADDLKSPWFQKHIARGASVQNLTHALEPFNQVAKDIQLLDKPWKEFNRLDDDHRTKYKKVVAHLKYLEGYTLESLQSFAQLVDSVNSSFHNCVQQRNATFMNIYQKFQEQQNVTEELMKNFDDFREKAGKFVTDHLDDQAIENYHCFYKLRIDDSENLMNISSAVDLMSKMKKDFSECLEQYGSKTDMLQVFLSFESVRNNMEEQYSLIQRFNNITGGAKVNVTEILNASGVETSLKCLRDGPYKLEKFDDLKEVNKFLGTLNDIPRPIEDVKATIEYLQTISKIKNGLENVEKEIKSVGSRQKRATAQSEPVDNPVLALNGSRLVAENMAVCALSLWDLVMIRENRNELLTVGNFDAKTKNDLSQQGLGEFMEPEIAMKKLLGEVEAINIDAKTLRAKSLLDMAQIFEEVAKIRGILGRREILWKMLKKPEYAHNPGGDTKKLQLLVELNLDFQTYESRTKDGVFTVKALISYFDQIFGHVVKPPTATVIIEKTSHYSLFVIVGVSIAICLVVFIAVIVAYGLTKKGKERYKNLWLYYFGKPADFERRWRYAKFMDSKDDINALLDATRETNKTNLVIALKKGAYVNAYNTSGNTALHFLTKFGRYDMALELVKNGADRTLLNYKNLTPEEMIPKDYKSLPPPEDPSSELAPKYEELAKMYKKYANKKFKQRVPEAFPSTSFRIWYEDRTDEDLSNKFYEKFSSITSTELTVSTTHCIVKTDERGVLVTDDINLLIPIFHGMIIVRESWMADCLKDEKVIEEDERYLVGTVKYKGVEYNTVQMWTNAIAKAEMPFLVGTFMVVLDLKYANLAMLTRLMKSLGCEMLSEFPNLDQFNVGARPYLHANLGPLFLFHDGSKDLLQYKTELFSHFTEEQLIVFLLKREINRDTRKNPPDVVKEVPIE